MDSQPRSSPLFYKPREGSLAAGCSHSGRLVDEAGEPVQLILVARLGRAAMRCRVCRPPRRGSAKGVRMGLLHPSVHIP